MAADETAGRRTVGGLNIRAEIADRYADVLTPAAWSALNALAPLDEERRRLMRERIERRGARARARRRIDFLDADATIGGTTLTVRDARAGQFDGGEIAPDLQRQWIQGTGPATRPRADLASGLRNVSYALLSGADGWMFDGEDALGQVDTMSLDNHRNLKLAFAAEPQFLRVAEEVAAEMNAWAREALGREIISDWRQQLAFTTRIFRARGLHLEDRHLRDHHGRALSASLVDAALYVVSNHETLRREGRSIVLYLPKIQTAQEAAFWNRLLLTLETHLALPLGCIRTYVLVEQLEASFQLMEIRAALAPRFVGYNTGRWDYINSVSDALAWDVDFVNPDISAITMTYGYMRHYESRVASAVNTPDRNGRHALWQGGMEPNIPVGSATGVTEGMARATAGGTREQQAGASGKWVAHWKMVHILRPIWESVGAANQMGRSFPPLAYDTSAAAALMQLEEAPRTVRGARDLLSVALQYGNAFARGYQAAALKPADFFGDPDVLYLMEDMATGEIRLSILWEWLHKGARFTQADAPTGVVAGDPFTHVLFERLLAEEYAKLLQATDRDVHDDSKATTLPIARAIAERYVLSPIKAPWFVDLLNLNLDDHDLDRAERRIDAFMQAFARDGTRLIDPTHLAPTA